MTFSKTTLIFLMGVFLQIILVPTESFDTLPPSNPNVCCVLTTTTTTHPVTRTRSRAVEVMVDDTMIEFSVNAVEVMVDDTMIEFSVNTDSAGSFADEVKVLARQFCLDQDIHPHQECGRALAERWHVVHNVPATTCFPCTPNHTKTFPSMLPLPEHDDINLHNFQAYMARLLSTMLGLPRMATDINDITHCKTTTTKKQPFKVLYQLSKHLIFPEDPANDVRFRLVGNTANDDDKYEVPTNWKFTDMLSPSALLWMGFTGRYDLSPLKAPEAHELVAATLADDSIRQRLYSFAHSNVGLPQGSFSPSPCGTITCKHVYMLTLLLGEIQRSGDVLEGELDVLEIGGGFGNMCWMVSAAFSFRSWTIFDMGFVQRFQEYFLRENERRHRERESESKRYVGHTMVFRRFEKQSVFLEKNREKEHPLVVFVDSELLHTWFHEPNYMREDQAEDNPRQYVLIATHSWSELPFEMFCSYLSALLVGTRQVEWLLYATQFMGGPNSSPVDHQRKLSLLRNLFTVVKEVHTNHGLVGIFVFRRKR